MYVEADQQREHKPEIIRPTDGKRRKHIYIRLMKSNLEFQKKRGRTQDCRVGISLA